MHHRRPAPPRATGARSSRTAGAGSSPRLRHTGRSRPRGAAALADRSPTAEAARHGWEAPVMTIRSPAVVAGVGTGIEGATTARAAVAEARRRLLPVRLVRAFSWDAARDGRASGAPGRAAARRAAERS